MKVIDLLNKIANGEEVPEKISYDGNDYKLVEYGETTKLYQCLSEPYELINIKTDRLNEEVAILIDIKIPEKLKWNEKSSYNQEGDTKKVQKILLSRSEQLKSSINEIIDYLEEKE